MGQSPEMALAHFKRIAEASDLPIIAFQYPLATGQGYPRETLLKMVEAGADLPRHQGLGRQRAAARDAHPHAAEPAPPGQRADHPQRVAVLLAGAGLQRAALRVAAASFPTCNRTCSRRCRRNDLAAARQLNDRIYPLAKVFYADPWADMHNRMKEALVLLGRLPRAVVRPPLVKLGRAEIDRIRAALVEAGLLDAKAARDAA